MKAHTSTLLLLCLLPSAFCPRAPAQGTAFTYQGQLLSLGLPANGPLDLTFSLWDGPVGATQVGGTFTNLNVIVSNSLVTVTLDFGAGVFTGADRWLEIGARTNSGSAFTTLVPRQLLTPAPYAIFAGAASNLTGTFPAGQLTGTLASNQLAGVYSGALTFNNASNGFTGNGAGLTGLNAGNLSSGTLADARLSANVALLDTAQTFTADITFSSGSQIFGDAGSASAPGYSFNGDANMGLFRPTADSVAFATAGAEQMRINSAGEVGIGTTAPEARLHVADGSAGTVTANASSVAVLERSANAYLSMLTPIANESGILFGSPTNSSDGAIVFNNTSAPRGLQIRTGGNVTKMVILADGKVGIGTISPNGPLDVTTTAGLDASVRLTSGGSWPLILNQSPSSLFTISNGGQARLTITSAGLVGVGRTPAANDLEVEGTASKTTAGSWLANSDARIKTDVQPIVRALEKLLQVRPVEFRYTADYRALHPGIEDRPYVNVVAQEFQRVFPESVKDGGDRLPDGEPILQVDTYPLTIYSAAAIQELNEKVEAQKAELKRRDAENAELMRRLEALEKIIRTQKSN